MEYYFNCIKTYLDVSALVKIKYLNNVGSYMELKSSLFMSSSLLLTPTFEKIFEICFATVLSEIWRLSPIILYGLPVTSSLIISISLDVSLYLFSCSTHFIFDCSEASTSVLQRIDR